MAYLNYPNLALGRYFNKPFIPQEIPQISVWDPGPRHWAPPLDGGGLVQLRVRDRVPPPQVLLH